LAQTKGYSSYSAERAAKELRTAQEQEFTSRAEWRTFRSEHKQALRDLRQGDTARAWVSYEGRKDPNKNVRRAVDFAEMRSRISRIKGSEKWKGTSPKQVVINAIMHDYVRDWHRKLDSSAQERLVWDNEGDTP
jgi:hypothetical protein